MSVQDSPAPKSMRTPLGRVRNLGSSHSGTTDFWRQRLTAVAMTLLIVPVIVIVLMLIGRNQAGAAQILGSLPIAIILVLFIIASAWPYIVCSMAWPVRSAAAQVRCAWPLP